MAVPIVSMPIPTAGTPTTSTSGVAPNSAGADAPAFPPVGTSSTGGPPAPPTSGGDVPPPPPAQDPSSGLTSGGASASKTDTAAAKAGGASATGGGPATGPRVSASRQHNLKTTQTVVLGGPGGAKFSFPPLSTSLKALKAPGVSWGSGWTPVDGKTGMYKHSDGTTARLQRVPHVVVSNTKKVVSVMTEYGKGRKFPDGTIVGMGADMQAWKISPNGNYEQIKHGVYKFGGVRVRLGEATAVHVKTPDGRYVRFDSIGNTRLGKVRFGGAATGGGPTAASTAVSGLSDAAAAKGSSDAAPSKGGDVAPSKGGDAAPPKGGDVAPGKGAMPTAKDPLGAGGPPPGPPPTGSYFPPAAPATSTTSSGSTATSPSTAGGGSQSMVPISYPTGTTTSQASGGGVAADPAVAKGGMAGMYGMYGQNPYGGGGMYGYGQGGMYGTGAMQGYGYDPYSPYAQAMYGSDATGGGTSSMAGSDTIGAINAIGQLMQYATPQQRTVLIGLVNQMLASMSQDMANGGTMASMMPGMGPLQGPSSALQGAGMMPMYPPDGPEIDPYSEADLPWFDDDISAPPAPPKGGVPSVGEPAPSKGTGGKQVPPPPPGVDTDNNTKGGHHHKHHHKAHGGGNAKQS